jgi:hypothetical protein
MNGYIMSFVSVCSMLLLFAKLFEIDSLKVPMIILKTQLTV